jgi:bisanhydrobacterioruberin hydratase
MNFKHLFSFRFALGLSLAMHFCGLGLLHWSVSRPLFEALTPFNLLVSLMYLLYFQADKNKFFLIFALLVFFGGFWIEYLGVQTGEIFGVYAYATSLGIKVWDIPILIGGNWLLLVLATGASVEYGWRLLTPMAGVQWLKITLSAFLMTLLDGLIEPFAIGHSLWHWYGSPVPMQNYVAWFFCAWVFQAFYFWLPFAKKNTFAPWVLAIQWLFFGLHTLFTDF